MLMIFVCLVCFQYLRSCYFVNGLHLHVSGEKQNQLYDSTIYAYLYGLIYFMHIGALLLFFIESKKCMYEIFVSIKLKNFDLYLSFSSNHMLMIGVVMGYWCKNGLSVWYHGTFIIC